MQGGGIYTRERSLEALELFIASVRARSVAKIVMLTIPTRFALLEPGRHWQELLYRDTAARYGIPVLDGYRLVCRLIGQDKMDTVGLLAQRVKQLVYAFGLPDQLVLSIAWRSLRDRGTPLNALGIHAFVDHAHVSPAIHVLLGTLLREFMLGERPAERPVLDEKAVLSSAVVVLSRPTGGRRITRSSSLLSRDMTTLTDKDTVTFRCPAGYWAYGLLVNHRGTHSFLRMHSPAGDATFDMRYVSQTLDWSAAVVPILDPVGDGEIKISISEQPDGHATIRSLHGTDASPGEAVAEIGDMILVKQDWRNIFPALDADRGTAFHIEDQPWAAQFVQAAALHATRQTLGIESDGRIIDAQCFDLAAKILMKAHPSLPPADQARLFLLLGMMDRLPAFLDTACTTHPDDRELGRMQAALDVFRSRGSATPDVMLARARTLINSGAIEES